MPVASVVIFPMNFASENCQNLLRLPTPTLLPRKVVGHLVLLFDLALFAARSNVPRRGLLGRRCLLAGRGIAGRCALARLVPTLSLQEG